MYVGYITEKCYGNTFFTPICILRSDEDLKTYLSMSQRKIDFEECEILDLKSIKKIRYIDVVYKNMNDSKWEECFTNDFETKVNGKPLVLWLKIAALASGCLITCFVFCSILAAYLTMEPGR